MYRTDVVTRQNKLSFHGDGSKFFGIIILNFILTLITLGIYLPWAKAARRRYLWGQTELNGSRFSFTGTGEEMFKGYILVYVLFVAYIATSLGVSSQIIPPSFILIFFVLFILVMPLAFFGAYRYRISRTSWRGVFGSFTGDRGYFIGFFYKQLFFTVISFGIYFPWMVVNVYKYFLENTEFGDIKMDFTGDGGNFLGIMILGGFLSFITFYIYLPIFMKNRYNFLIDSVQMEQDSQRSNLHSTLEGNEAWGTIVLNALLTAITFGIYGAWAQMALHKMYINNIQIPENIDFDNLKQSEQTGGGALGDQLLDAFDIGF